VPIEPRELSDSEIQRRYGDTIAEGFEAFAQDPEYLIRMVERARVLIDASAARRAKSAKSDSDTGA
jgi:hypothetical protein